MAEIQKRVVELIAENTKLRDAIEEAIRLTKAQEYDKASAILLDVLVVLEKKDAH